MAARHLGRYEVVAINVGASVAEVLAANVARYKQPSIASSAQGKASDAEVQMSVREQRQVCVSPRVAGPMRAPSTPTPATLVSLLLRLATSNALVAEAPLGLFAIGGVSASKERLAGRDAFPHFGAGGGGRDARDWRLARPPARPASCDREVSGAGIAVAAAVRKQQRLHGCGDVTSPRVWIGHA